jgi:general nucleoside transport system permease protein
MYYFTFEKRLYSSFKIRTGITLLSILTALIIGGVFFLIIGINPFEVYKSIVTNVFFNTYAWEDLFLKTSPLLLTGIAVALAANLKIWNIGADGQFYMGTLGATWVALNYGEVLSSASIIPIMFLAAVFAGSLWALLPAIFRAQFGVNEIITTLLMNYIAMSWVDYLIFGSWRDPKSNNFPVTAEFSESTFLPTLMNSSVHVGILIALVVILLVYLLLRKTNLGVQITIAGDNPDAGLYSGINIKRLIVIILVMSGAIAGVAGMLEVAGTHHRLQQNISLGYGYTGIIIAWLARNHPLGVIFYAFFMAVVFVGGENLQISFGLPKAMIDLFQGIILFCVLGMEIFAEYRLKIKRV